MQTGGSGSTWKSYTNPLGDNADHLYSGTISIPGVTEGGLQRIGGHACSQGVDRSLGFATDRPKRVLVAVDPAVKDHNPPALAGRKGVMTHDKAVEDPKNKARQAATKPLVAKYGKYLQKQ